VFNAGAFGDPAPRRAMIQKATEEFGCLGILIDDAALQTMRRSLEEMDEQWTDTSGDNLRSRYLLRNAALPHTKSVSAVVSTTSAPLDKVPPQFFARLASKHRATRFAARAIAQAGCQRGYRSTSLRRRDRVRPVE
jgi:NAD(P)-dependent dehydrogenase (short-subunit alcohol dehydrogenase family)